MPTAAMFQDEIIPAKELNRRSGDVLDRAMHNPVTITRNSESFVLAARKLAACWVHGQQTLDSALLALLTALELIRGERLPAEHPMQWLAAFDQVELNGFMAEMADGYAKAKSRECAWGELDNIIHEWRETALALRNPAVAGSYSAASDEVPLTEPPRTDDDRDCPS